MSGRHVKRKPTKRELRGKFTGVGDKIGRDRVVIGFDLRDIARPKFYTVSTKKKKKKKGKK